MAPHRPRGKIFSVLLKNLAYFFEKSRKNLKFQYNSEVYRLYHYVHCPYCVRVRMVLGHLNIPYQSTVLPYNDEKAPIALAGKKMLPIMEFPDGTLCNESLDIISKLDQNNQLDTHSIINNEMHSLNQILSQIASPAHNLIMPYWIYTPEFDQNAREYFRGKKEEKKGPFHQLVQNRQLFTDQISQLLEKVSPQLSPYFRGQNFGLRDILMASHLWGLYIVPEFQFPPQIHDYLQSISQICRFNYHEDFWPG